MGRGVAACEGFWVQVLSPSGLAGLEDFGRTLLRIDVFFLMNRIHCLSLKRSGCITVCPWSDTVMEVRDAVPPARSRAGRDQTRKNDWQRACRALARVEAASAEPSLKMKRTAVVTAGRGGHWQEALGVFAHDVDTQRDVLMYNVTMTACEKGTQWLKTLHLLSQLGRDHLQCSIVTHGAALSAFQRAEDWSAATLLFGELEQKQCPANLIMYNAAMGACGVRWRQAVQLMSELSRVSRVDRDVVTYTSAISACAAAHRWQTALHLLAELQNQRLEEDIVVHNSVISACSLGQQWQRSLSLLQGLGHANAISYGATVAGCERCGCWQQALAILRSMWEGSVQGNVIVLNSVISACEKAGQWKAALQLLGEVDGSKLQPDIITFNAVISACENCSRWQQALQSFSRLQELRLQGSIVTYSALISACGKSSRWEEAIQVLADLRSSRLAGNTCSGVRSSSFFFFFSFCFFFKISSLQSGQNILNPNTIEAPTWPFPPYPRTEGYLHLGNLCLRFGSRVATGALLAARAARGRGPRHLWDLRGFWGTWVAFGFRVQSCWRIAKSF